MQTILKDIPAGKKTKVVKLIGGYEVQKRFRVFGIMEGKIIKVLTIQPFKGPVVVEVEGRQTTIGRGMAQRILVEAIE